MPRCCAGPRCVTENEPVIGNHLCIICEDDDGDGAGGMHAPCGAEVHEENGVVLREEGEMPLFSLLRLTGQQQDRLVGATCRITPVICHKCLDTLSATARPDNPPPGDNIQPPPGRNTTWQLQPAYMASGVPKRKIRMQVEFLFL